MNAPSVPEMVPTVSAVVFDADGRLLLIHENYDRRRYGCPGGRVEFGERPADAAVREAKEETLCDVEVGYLIGLYCFADVPFLSFVFACTIVDGIPSVPDTGEIDEVGWFDPANLPSPTTIPLRHTLDDTLAGACGGVRTFETSS